jgi:hypothetical protein
VVYSRESTGQPLKVFPPADYISVTVETVVNPDSSFLETKLGEWNVFEQLPKKNIYLGYKPMEDLARRLGAMSKAMDTSNISVTGRVIPAKQVLLF